MDSTRTGNLKEAVQRQWKDLVALGIRVLLSLLGLMILLADLPDWVQIGFWRDLEGEKLLNESLSAFVALGLIVVPSLRFRVTPFVLVAICLTALYPMTSWFIGMFVFISALLLTPLFRPHFGGPDSTWQRLTIPFRNWFLAVFGLSLMIYLIVEIPRIRSSLNSTANESNCKSMKTPETCGRVALHIINNARQDAQLEDGLKRLDAICKDGNLPACRFAIDKRSPGYINKNFHDELLRKLNHECLNEVPEACWLLARYSDDIPRIGHKKIQNIAERQCEESGNFFSCQTIRSFLPIPGEELCQNAEDPGVLVQCCSEGIPSNRLQSHSACAEVPGEDVRARAARFVGKAMFNGVPVTEEVLPDSEEFMLACVSGDALSCVAEVLRRENNRPLGTPTPDGLKEVWEELLGEPCTTGSNLACLAHAARLIDVPLNETPNVDRAEEVLNTACDRGHDESCWWLVSLFEGYEERTFDQAVNRCRRGDSMWACWVLEDLTLKKLGLHHWKMNRFQETRAYEDLCVAEDAVSCSDYVSMFDRNGQFYPVQIRRFYSAASLGCKLGRLQACERAAYISTFFPATDVKELLCRRNPSACRMYEPKIP